MIQKRLYAPLAFLFVGMALLLMPTTRVQAQVSTICFYEEIEGEINNVNLSQTYIFTATGQHTVTVEMEVLSGSLDPLLEVYSEETGERIAVATNIMLGGQYIAKIFNLRVSEGDYSIIASRVGGERGNTTGNYKLLVDVGGSEDVLELEQVHFDGIVSGGGNLFDGDFATGYLTDVDRNDNRGVWDLWYFSGSAGDLVTITFSSNVGLRDSSNLIYLSLWEYDALVNLEDSSANLAREFIDSTSETISLRISNFRLPTTGRYVVYAGLCEGGSDGRCYGDGDSSVIEDITYSLNILGSGGQRPDISCTTPVSTIDLASAPLDELGVEPNTVVLNNDPNSQGMIDDENPINYFAFAAQEGNLVTITMTRTSDDLIPLLGVQNSNGDLLDRETADLSERRAVMNFLVPETGWYVIIATREDIDEGTTSGGYQLQFAGSSFIGETAAAPDIGVTATVVRSGQVAEGDISDGQVTFYYLISLDRDEEITLTMRRTTGDLEPVVAMMDTDLSVIERGLPDLAGRTSTLTFTAPTRGWYVIATTRDDAEAGTSAGGFALQIGE